MTGRHLQFTTRNSLPRPLREGAGKGPDTRFYASRPNRRSRPAGLPIYFEPTFIYQLSRGQRVIRQNATPPAHPEFFFLNSPLHTW